MTDDGGLVYKITHPKHNIDKTYIAKIKGTPKSKDIYKFESGLYIDDYKTSTAKLDILTTDTYFSHVKIIIHEGRNRQVRKMCDAIGYPVVSLKRVAVGNIELGNLSVGKYRYLTQEEIDYLTQIE